jgi:hypothetical protein
LRSLRYRPGMGLHMILRLVGAQLDSGLPSQGSGTPSGLVRSVRVFIGQAVRDRGTIASISRQGPSLIDAGDANDTSDAGNSEGVSSGWSNLDTAAKYLFYASLLAAPLHPHLLNVFA